MSKRSGMSLSELCAFLRRGPHFIRHLQQGLGLPLIPNSTGYPRCYAAFLDRVIYLRVFGVPLDDIASLFALEKKLMQLLKVDTAAASPLWYMEACEIEDSSQTRLLLTNFNIGRWIGETGIVQYSLDFGTASPELFKSAEMGEDILHVFGLYREQAAVISKRLREERNVVRDALEWVNASALRKA
ncbi:MAG: hypothetical protein R6X19_01030 [Kiritimatiellia bacterium]